METKFKLMDKVTGNVGVISIVGRIVQIHQIGEDIEHLTEVAYDVAIIEPSVSFEELMLESELQLIN